MEQIKQLIKYTITGKLIVLNIAIFLIINLFVKGINPFYFNYFFIQIPGFFSPGMILANFSHSDFFHLFVNLYGLFLFGAMIENMSGKRIFVKLIIFSMIFTIFGVFFFSSGPVLGFSGILMGMLSFMFFKYKYNLGIDERTQIGILLALNIGIGFMSGISLVGHLFGAIGGLVYAQLLNKLD